MNNIWFASIALAASIATAPFALADSFGYKTSDSKLTANNTPLVQSSAGGWIGARQPAATRVQSGRQVALEPFSSQAFNSELDADVQEPSKDSESLLDNLVSPEDSERGIRGSAGVLVDVGGYRLNLFFGGPEASGSKFSRSRYFYYGDNGHYRITSEVPQRKLDQLGTGATLSEAPEPGSLFLLGTGLLCLALMLFWRAAKRQTAGT